MPARDENVPVPRASTASLSARRHSHRRAAQASASKVAKRKRNALGSELSEDNANLPSSGSEWEAEIPPSESSSSSDHDDCDSSPIRAPGRKKPKMCADSGPSSSSRPLCEDHLVNPDSAGTSRDSSKRKVVEVGLDGRVSGANGTSAKRRRIRDSDLRVRPILGLLNIFFDPHMTTPSFPVLRTRGRPTPWRPTPIPVLLRCSHLSA